ncbi:MAG: hypothetical protein KBD21_01825 [Candidatus Pacebacteria bacterium]|nr:hypothetical protein [Candidatus Paceibacterota bacterium]
MDLLIAAHELHEARACLSAGVSDTLVDAFDFAHSVLDNTGQISEPGDNPKAPYHAEHVAATKIELTLARRLRVNWDRYGAHVERLYLM